MIDLKTNISELQLPFIEKHWKWLLILLTLAAFCIRIGYHYVNPFLNRDSMVYIQIAENWIRLGNYQAVMAEIPQRAWIPPVFCGILKTMCCLLPVSVEQAGLIINIVAGSLLLPVCFGICGFFTTSRTVCLSAALLCAIHPQLVDLSCSLLRDTPYLTLATFTVYLILHYWNTQQTRFALFSGLSTALTLCMRYEALELPVVFFLTVILLLFKKKISWKKTIGDLLLFGIVMLTAFILIHILSGTFSYMIHFRNQLMLYLVRFIGKGV